MARDPTFALVRPWNVLFCVFHGQSMTRNFTVPNSSSEVVVEVGFEDIKEILIDSM
jgi:hypothetical protein